MRKLQQTEDQMHQINSQETECQSELKKDFEDSNDLKAMRREGEEISDAQLDEHLSLASSLQQNVARIQKRINCIRANNEETFEAPKGDIIRKNKVFKKEIKTNYFQKRSIGNGTVHYRPMARF